MAIFRLETMPQSAIGHTLRPCSDVSIYCIIILLALFKSIPATQLTQ